MRWNWNSTNLMLLLVLTKNKNRIQHVQLGKALFLISSASLQVQKNYLHEQHFHFHSVVADRLQDYQVNVLHEYNSTWKCYLCNNNILTRYLHSDNIWIRIDHQIIQTSLNFRLFFRNVAHPPRANPTNYAIKTTLSSFLYFQPDTK